MLFNQLYYRLKPYIPWGVRMGARHLIAQAQRRLYADIWPIDAESGIKPENWRGWPDGKKFAFVLTHDVEGVVGLEKTRALMELEMRQGFRSSFNFVPEGEYRVPAALRGELDRHGFEVGVHDLRHDGKLFWPSTAAANSGRINGHLRDWRAKGFRSGFMLHDSTFLNSLDIDYDASTFDTDPFEPQPVGVRTVFPFWISRPNGGGFVELPYTLPQDSTMFFVLREKNTDLWKRKLDWIVQRGGMALVNVHPDYINFNGGQPQPSEYAVELYAEFLAYVAKNYPGQYWNALPREISSWYREKYQPAQAPVPVVPQPLKNKSAAVILYSNYATDPRPRRESEALHRAGMEVDVICLRRDSSEPWRETIDGVNVYHAPLKRRRAGKLVYMAQYGWFLCCAFGFLTVRSLFKRYDLVHVHNMPDFLVFSAVVPKFNGAKVILDLHDPMPELFHSIYGLTEGHFILRWLEKMERRSISFAHQVVTPNLAFKKLFGSRSCRTEKIETVMNSPETAIFNVAKHPALIAPASASRPFVLMYHGLIVERHGLDIAVRALAQLRQKIPNLQLHMYGEETEYSKKIAELVRELKLEDAVKSHGFKTLAQIAERISTIDVGIIPNRSSSFTAINFPTRIFEYLAMHKPVIVPDTQGIQDYFGESDIIYFQAGDVDSLAQKIAWAYENAAGLATVLQRGLAIYEKNSWDMEEKKFIQLVGHLVHKS